MAEKRQIKAHKGGRDKHVSIYVTPLEKERLERLRGNMSQSDFVNIAIRVMDAMSAQERQEWLSVMTAKP